jgi:hypothetical protein
LGVADLPTLVRGDKNQGITVRPLFWYAFTLLWLMV